ncbi:MAG: LLM class flavin-dependent oxidoreductase [Micromonosporaceae bacterium]|nr:LLM class flavin-dependent oxidoreductase [Micromonosporaceae bacterium]
MPDYGHDLLFGCFLPPLAERSAEVVRLAQRAERVGLDLVSIQDHPYQPAFLDTWTLLSVIAARTERVRVLPNVANLPLRPPAVLARAAASLDLLSGGRAELGLGAGGFWAPIAGMGGPRRQPAEAVAALAEAIHVIRSLWTPGRGVRFDGTHYRLAGAKPGPQPAHPIGIWLGAYRRRMLQLTGRAADGWLPSAPYAPPEELAMMNRTIDEAATGAGRDPAAVRRLYNLAGSFGTGRGFLDGPPAAWAEQLAELALTEGISGFIQMVDLDAGSELDRFAAEVAPAVRELVAAERGGTGEPGRGSGPEPGSPPQPRPPERNTLGVAPTPPPAQRHSADRPWDESTRPEPPAPGPDTGYSDQGRAAGQHLVDIHDNLRQELEQLRDLVRQVGDGERDAGAARSALHTMTVRQNRWTLGAYCEGYCRIVTAHHTLEDAQMFPQLRQADHRLGPVVDRLAEEHEVIAGVVEQVDAALVAMVGGTGRVAQLRAAVDLLADTLLSHLSYEERVLVKPLARLSAG